MASKGLDKKIFEKLMRCPKVKLSPQTIRNELSKIRGDNPGITLNAAAHLFAQNRGFSLRRSLNEEDILSLQYVRNLNKPVVEAKPRKIKAKEAYPQYGEEFHREANENANIYPYIYILENSLRKIILKRLGNNIDWWNDKFVSKEIQRSVEFVLKAERKYPWLPSRALHPVFYVNLNDLYKIINKNWDKFKDVFGDTHHLRTWIDECYPLRCMVAHNIKTRPRDRKNIELRVEQICNLIKRKNKS